MGEKGVGDIKKVIGTISIILFIVSSIILVYTGDTTPPVVQSLSNTRIGEHVAVSGVVVWKRSFSGYTIAVIDTGVSKIKVFSRSTDLPTVGTFSGHVAEYKGEREIVVD